MKVEEACLFQPKFHLLPPDISVLFYFLQLVIFFSFPKSQNTVQVIKSKCNGDMWQQQGSLEVLTPCQTFTPSKAVGEGEKHTRKNETDWNKSGSKGRSVDINPDGK